MMKICGLCPHPLKNRICASRKSWRVCAERKHLGLRIFKNFEANFGVSYMLMYLSTTARTQSPKCSTAHITSVAHSPKSKVINRRDLLVAAAVAARVLPFGHTHDATLHNYYSI